MIKYFWHDVAGLNADIDRHCAEEQKLLNKITELEQIGDNASVIALRFYRHALYQLQQSKADTVNRLGRKGK